MIETLPHWFVKKWRSKMSKKNYVDFKDAYNAIGKTTKQLEKSHLEAVNLAGEYAAKELKKRTPVADITSDHAKNHIVYSKATTNKPVSEVGFDKEVAWRVHFVEYGTIKQRPQPFMQQTMKDIETQVGTIIKNEMARRLKQ